MNLLDDDILPLMVGDYHGGDDVGVDEDHHSEAPGPYSSSCASLSSLKNKLPRQVIRGPPGAQRINRGIKRKTIENPKSPVRGTITEQEQEDDSAVIKDCSQEIKRFKADLRTAATATVGPFLSEPRGYMGQNFTVPFFDFPRPPPDPEDIFLGHLDSSSTASLAHATHANQKTSPDNDPFSLSLEAVQVLIEKENSDSPHCGTLKYVVHEGRPGIGKEDTRRLIPEADRLPDNLEPDSSECEKEDDEKEHVEKDDSVLLVAKIEPGLGDEELPEMQSGMLGSIPEASEEGQSLQTPFKRPRGRPRKHPLPVPGENLNKMGKGRSKTGCITCRKRKKKCDEAKPKCLNCEKNAVLCEGYQPLAPWKSGKEKAASECMERGRSSSYFPQSPASVYANYTFGTPQYSLPLLINGIETDSDRIFFAHYCTRLSGKLTVEGPECSAFRQQMLPMAVQHEGLLHSILALSGANIDWKSDYGQSLLDKHPDLSIREIEDRGHHHHNLAMEQINRDMDQQRELEGRGEAPDPAVIKVRYGQMLCLVIKALAEGNTEGAHRMHLKAYENLAALYPSDGSPFMKFVHEYFKYHVCFDQLVAPPKTYPVLDNEEFWLSPNIHMTIGPTPLSPTKGSFNNTVLSEHAGGIFGLQQEIYNAFMRRIGKIRQDIRERMEQRQEPHVDYAALYHASQLEGQIRNWADASPPPAPQADTKLSEQNRWNSDQAFYNIGMLYKNMLWVYLYRTIYPPNTQDYSQPLETNGAYLPSPTTMRYNDRIRNAVNQAIGYMQQFKGEDPCQTMLMSPAFMIGCAAFEEDQRAAIRRIVGRVKSYTTLKNANPAMQVLEEVWKRMDGKGDQKWKGDEGILRNSRGMRDGGRESSWDWEKIAEDLHVDFLAT